MVIAYSAPPFRFKEKPFLDSFTSSCHFVTPLLYGVLLVGGRLSNLVLVVLAYFTWGMASHAFGSVQDVPFDRKAGIGSIATVIGSALTVRFSAIAYVVAALLVVIAFPTVLGIGGAAVFRA